MVFSGEGKALRSWGPLTQSEIDSLRQAFARDEALIEQELNRNPVARPAWAAELRAKRDQMAAQLAELEAGPRKEEIEAAKHSLPRHRFGWPWKPGSFR